MLRLIFILVLAFVAIIAGSSIALWHFFGWKGLIALPFILIVLLWLGKKVGGYFFKRVALSLFEMKSKVLRGASMKVHSVTAVAQPKHEGEVEEAEEDEEPDEADEPDDAEPDS